MTWKPWQTPFAKRLASCVPVATTISWFAACAMPDSARSGISLSAESKPQGPSRKGGSVQARCRKSGGAHGLKTIGVVPVKKPALLWRRQHAVLAACASDKTSKQTLLTKGNGANGGKLTIVHKGSRSRMVQDKITSPCVNKKEVRRLDWPRIIRRSSGTHNEKLGLRAQRPDKGKDRVTAIQAGNGLD